MRLTVCELPADIAALQDAWEALVTHSRDEASDLVLLPEMPFHHWLAASKDANQEDWDASVAAHDLWHARLGELGAAAVVGSRPVVVGGKRHNEAFVWTAEGYRGVHHKYYLPDEDGFWEATWYDRGEKEFHTAESPAGVLGLLVCTELWFTAHARDYGKEGAAIIANPRATEWSTRDKWLAGGRAAAVMSGAFCLSSNRSGRDPSGLRWGGLAWVIDPDGTVLATTSEEEPFATVAVDPLEADKAKAAYPRYVAD